MKTRARLMYSSFHKRVLLKDGKGQFVECRKRYSVLGKCRGDAYFVMSRLCGAQ